MCLSFENMSQYFSKELECRNAEIEYVNKSVKKTFLLRSFSIGSFKQEKKKPWRKGLMIKI